MEVKPRSAPTYRIFRDQHGIPQFEPKRGSQALKDALIYAFPKLETELQLMQAALRKFFDSERGNKFVCELPENNLQASLAKGKEPEVSTAQASLRGWKVALGQQRPPRTPSRSRASSIASTRGSSRASSRMPSRPETPTQFQEASVDIVGGGTVTTWMLSSGQEVKNKKRQPYDPIKRRKVTENRGNACERHRASKTACDPYSCPENKLHSKVTDVTQADNANVTEDAAQRSRLQAKPTPKKEFSETHGQKAGLVADTISCNSTSTEGDYCQIGTGLYQGIPVQDVMASQAQDSPSSFHHLSTYSDASSWTDTFHSGPSPWISCSSSSTPGRDLSTESNVLLQVVGSEEDMARQIQMFDTSEALSSNITYVPPSENPAQTSLCPSFSQLEKPFNYSDDPFMGWANKRASHIFDDYGWVLSHVENL